MLRVLSQLIPDAPVVACSGGLDSMVLLDFLVRGRRPVTAAFFHHGTSASGAALIFLMTQMHRYPGVELKIGYIQGEPSPGQSREQYWREQRYEWLIGLGRPIVTAHHLDDAVETWVMWSLRGCPKLPQLLRHPRVTRPFLTATRKQIQEYQEHHGVPYIEDPSNQDQSFDRNYCRHTLMPGILRLSPGIHTVIRKKIEQQYRDLTEGQDPVYENWAHYYRHG